MLLSILFAVLFLFLFVAAVVLCAPIAVSGAGAFAAGRAEGFVRLSWLHPGVVRCALDIRKGTMDLVVFGMRINTQGKAAAQEEKKSAEASAEPAAAAHVTEPGAQGAQPSKEEEPVLKSQPSKDEEPSPEKAAIEPVVKKTAPWTARAKRVKQLWVFIGDASFRGKALRWVFRILRSLLRTCSVARVRVSLKAGLDDPAKTGLLYGWYQGFTHMLSAPGPRRLEIECEPVFTDATFEAAAEAEIATSVARLCLPIVIALVTFPYLHAYVLYRKARRIE